MKKLISICALVLCTGAFAQTKIPAAMLGPDVPTASQVTAASNAASAAQTTANTASTNATQALTQSLTAATTQATTSGTVVDFTSIPSWVRRITVLLNQVSTNGTSVMQVQIGSGSITSTGYVSYGGVAAAAGTNTTTVTSGFAVTASTNAGYNQTGIATLVHMGSNLWAFSYVGGQVSGTTGIGTVIGGAVTLSGTLDRLRLTTVNGTDAFDNGSVNIVYD